MKKRKIAFLSLIIICTSFLTGCWNYRELEKLAIVSAVAIDKDGKDKVLATVEIVNVQQEKQQSLNEPVYIQAVGETYFDAIRSMVAIQGKKLYWSHAKAVIVSEEIAKEGIVDVLDFLNRDAEVRSDMWVLISKERNARDIFKSKPIFEKVIGFEIDDTMRSQQSVSKYPATELYDFLDNVGSEESSTILPVIQLLEVRGILATYISGAAIIKKDKLLGYLTENDTRSLLWVQDKLRGGVYPVEKAGNTDTNVSLEISRSRTKVKPELIDGTLTMKVEVITDVNIGEIMGKEDFINGKNRALLKKDGEAQIKRDIEGLIKKAQKEYKCDFLGFGKKIKASLPGVWKSIEKDWDKVFQDINTDVQVTIRIKGSATTIKPIKVGK